MSSFVTNGYLPVT
ncbi:RNA polymerase subunit RPO18, partial [Monkeypox virus]